MSCVFPRLWSLLQCKTACKGRGGLPAVWCALRWVVPRRAGGRPVAAYVVGVGCGFVFVRFRLIPPDSTKTLLIPLKRYGFRQNNHGGSCSLHPAKTRHIPE
ncbi:hypothetical protein A4I99_21150 [Salmonella enterica subsp. enterica serovar Reading]|nr:hypothetical protein [Salmonella enterica subsp. enterica serovar Reading]